MSYSESFATNWGVNSTSSLAAHQSMAQIQQSYAPVYWQSQTSVESLIKNTYAKVYREQNPQTIRDKLRAEIKEWCGGILEKY